MKKTKKWLMAAALTGFMTAGMVSCKSKPTDAELKAKVETAVSTTQGVMVSVEEGVAKLSGEVADEASKLAAEAAAKATEGVKSVENMLTVTPPPPPPIIIDDSALNTAVSAVVSAYKGVVAEVKEGVVTLKGNIKKADLQPLMMALQALNPKNIENQLSTK